VSACLGAAVSVALVSPAAAEPSTWFYAGAGPAELDFEPEERPVLLQIETGLGTPAKHGIVLGGLFQLHTYLQHGADLGAAIRTTHANFVLGSWGAALDLGFYQRWWGGDSTGASARVVLGAPLGITASIGGTLGTGEHRTLSATLGIDFARLTVHRTTLLNWWSNPFPPETGAEAETGAASSELLRF
jgi:hypothetical protein